MQAEELCNKEFAFCCLNRLKAAGKLTAPVLRTLTDAEACRRLFRCSGGFPVLMEVPAGCSGEELTQLCHFSGKRRYYQDRFLADGRTFVVVNHWYGPNRSMPDNRTPFLDWVTALEGRTV